MARTHTMQQASDLYAGFMEEVKLRLVATGAHLERARAKGPDDDWSFLDVEFCYLQVRLICELIALASLSAHHDTPEVTGNSLLKSYNAKKTLHLLSKINPHCFPKPVRLGRHEGRPHIEARKGQHLSRDGLQDMYHAADHVLHRGALKPMLEGKRKAYSIDKLIRWQESVKGLLDEHMILLPAHSMVLVVNLMGFGQPVQVYQAKAMDPDGFVYSPPSNG